MQNKTLIERRFARTLHHYNTIAVVQRRIADRLAELTVHHDPQLIVEIGAGSGFLTTRMTEKYPKARYIANDITEKSQEFLPSYVEFRAADGETMSLPEQCDIITSASTVQWFDNLPQFIERAKESLSDCGVIAISTFGEKNFSEITKTLNYYTKAELEQIVHKNGLKILHSEQWCEQMSFDSPIDVLRHIKATGVNAIESTRWTSGQLQRFVEEYPTPATLTFHPIIIICTKSPLT